MPPRRPRRPRRWPWLVLLALLVLLLLWCGRPRLTLGTFNIRTFPGEQTEPSAVAAAIAALDADVFAAQEIGDVAAFDAVLERASALAGRRYRAIFGAARRGWRVGVVYDAERLELADAVPLSDEVAPLGIAALLRGRDGRPLLFAALHLKAGGQPEDLDRRRQQWRHLRGELPRLAARFAAPLVVAGDLNTTGYLDPDSEERRLVDGIAAELGLQVATASLPCSMYWHTRGRYEVSLLDHVMTPQASSVGEPEVLGMCAALACEPQETAPPGFDSVSDHCPVRVQLR